MKTVLSIVAILILVVAGCDTKANALARRTQCVHNLHLLRNVEEGWAGEMHKTTNDTPRMEDLGQYIKGEFPKCPDGGTYTLGPVGTNPKCSIKGHELPKPNAN